MQWPGSRTSSPRFRSENERSDVLVGYVDEPLFRQEAALGVLRLRRTERTAVERLLERCVDVAGTALDLGAIRRPEPLDVRRRPPGEILDIEANIEKRCSAGPIMWDRISQRAKGVLNVLGLLVGRELLELGPR